MGHVEQRIAEVNGIKCPRCGRTYNAKKALACYDGQGRYIYSYSHCNYCRCPVAESVEYDEQEQAPL